MLPAYLLTINITAKGSDLSETEFRELLAPCIAYLDALSGAFDKKPCSASFYPPDPESENSKEWSVRCAIMISLGRERAKFLTQLYNAIVRLIIFECPDFEIRAGINKLQFS